MVVGTSEPHLVRFSQPGLLVKPQCHREYWRHLPSGKLWAVELVDGSLAGACGPLDPREVAPIILPGLVLDFRDLLWIRDHREDFSRDAFPTHACA